MSTVSEEKFQFSSKARNKLLLVLIIGFFITLIGYFVTPLLNHATQGADHSIQNIENHGNESDHATIEKIYSAEVDSETHHGTSPLFKRVLANLWINSVFYVGISLIGIFFFAIQYAAQAGWSAGLKRIPLVFGHWLPFGFITLFLLFIFARHDIFHWTHAALYGIQGGDDIVKGKASYFFFPMDAGTFPAFWMFRFLIFFTVWYLIFRKLKALALQEDLMGGNEQWYKMRKLSTIFLVFFAISTSIAAWDWIMSIDVHWFSTMFGWYMFASWWVTGLALMLFIIILLKEKGYLAIVNSNHLHDLGKFVFGFSIFWTYIWFSQFLLIYYANLPEETIYFLERWRGSHYEPVFYINLILNFFFPFLLLMTRDAKRHIRILKVVCPAIIFGHWLDFYLMITPGTVGKSGGFGLIEIGIILVYFAAFLLVFYSALAKIPLFAKNHPMLKESLHHHI